MPPPKKKKNCDHEKKSTKWEGWLQNLCRGFVFNNTFFFFAHQFQMFKYIIGASFPGCLEHWYIYDCGNMNYPWARESPVLLVLYDISYSIRIQISFIHRHHLNLISFDQTRRLGQYEFDSLDKPVQDLIVNGPPNGPSFSSFTTFTFWVLPRLPIRAPSIRVFILSQKKKKKEEKKKKYGDRCDDWLGFQLSFAYRYDISEILRPVLHALRLLKSTWKKLTWPNDCPSLS